MWYDDVIDELRLLVAIGDLSNELQRATQDILQMQLKVLDEQLKKPSGGGSGGGGGGGGGRSGEGFFRRWGRRIKGGAKRGHRVGRAMGSGGMKNLFGRVGGAAGGAIGGALAGFAAVAVAAGVALKEMHDKVNEMTEEAVRAARKLAEVSGSMAAVMAVRDIKETMRDMRQGEAQAGTMKNLVDAEQRRKDASEPIVNAFENAKNNVLAIANETLVPMLNMVNSILEGMKELPWGVGEAIKKAMKGDEVKPGGIAGMMPSVMDHAKKLDAAGRSLMDQARTAAHGGGFAAPSGGTTAVGRPPL